MEAKPSIADIKAELARPPQKFSLDYIMSLPSLPDNVFTFCPKEEPPDAVA